MTLATRNLLALLLLLFGTTQMLGYLLDLTALRGIGAASLLAPLPKVFSDVDGLETFASDFDLLLLHPNGEEEQVSITPELYAKLAGPYKRRNVYGAALSYAPRLPESLWRAVFDYGLGPQGPLRTELGLPLDAEVRILIRTKTKGRTDRWVLGG